MSMRPLSAAQRAVWLHEQVAPGTLGNHLATGVEIVGPLHAPTFLLALKAASDAHPALRSAIRSADDVPYRLELDETNADIEYVEAEAWTEDEIEEYWLQTASLPLDIASGRCCRFRLLRRTKERHVLVSIMHHAVTDGWSTSVFADSVCRLYEAMASGTDAKPIRAGDYDKYVESQHHLLRGEKGAALQTFWEAELAGSPSPVELPLDRPRTPTPTFHGGLVTKVLSEQQRSALTELAARHDSSLQELILAAFSALLHRYTNQTDLIIGVPRAGRSLRTIRMIGNFVNPVLHRSRPDPNMAFSQLLAEVSETQERISEHEAYPFERVARLYPYRSDGSAHPYLRAVFVWQKAPSVLIASRAMAAQMVQLGDVVDDGGAFEVKSRRWPTTIVNQELRLLGTEVDGELVVTFDYARDLLDEQTVDVFAQRFVALLNQVIDRPDIPIGEILLDAGSEREGGPVSGPTLPLPNLRVDELIGQQCRKTPDAIAVRDDNRELTYQQLDREAKKLAARIGSYDLPPNSIVALGLTRSVDLVVGMLGIMRAGAAYLPLDPDLPSARLAFMIEDAGVDVVLTDEDFGPLLPKDRPQLVLDRHRALTEDLTPVAESDTTSAATSPDDLAYLIYTSGSTGSPKGVKVSHRNVLNLLLGFSEQIELDANDVWLAVTTASFDIAVLELLLPLVSGAQVVVASSEATIDPVALGARLDEVEATVMQATPSHWRMLFAGGWGGSQSLTALCGGEAMTSDVAKQLGETVREVWNVYGPTETTVWSSIGQISDSTEIHIGLPIANTTFDIVDEQYRSVPPGLPGQLVIGGSGVSAGYHNRPQLNDERFLTDQHEDGSSRYLTGDLAVQRLDGTFTCLGRLDDQIKVRGHRVELGEIEAALRQLPGVADSVAAGERLTSDRARLVAYVVAEEGYDVDPTALRLRLEEALPPYAVPSAIGLIDSIPTTPNGKVDRQGLDTSLLSRLSNTAPSSPQTATERDLVQIWEDLFNLDDIDRGDNFFDLGGQSLLATQVVNRLRLLHDVEIPVRAVLDHPTIAELASVIEVGTTKAPALPAITSVQRPADIPLSFNQERLWFLQELDPDSSAFNIALVLDVVGPLDVKAFTGALSEVSQQQESLRTGFRSVDGIANQVVADHVEIPVDFVDWIDDPDGELSAAEAVRDASSVLFDLAVPPLLRVSIHRIEQSRHKIALNVHHIIADRWSLSLLGKQILDAYHLRVAGETTDVAPVSVQPADHALWQRHMVESGAFDNQLAYWQDQLRDVPLLQLPTDRQRQIDTRYDGATLREVLNGARTRQVDEFARSIGTSTFAVYLAGFIAILYRYSGDSEIAVGIPVAGRTTAESETLVANLSNVIIIRANINPDTRFTQLVSQVSEAVAEGLVNQDIPFASVVRSSKDPELVADVPLRAFFNLPSMAHDLPSVPGLNLTVHPIENAAVAAEVSMTIDLSQGRSTLEYNASLFEGIRMQRLLGHYWNLLDDALESGDAPVDGLMLLSNIERDALIEAGADQPAKEMPTALLHDLIGAQAKAQGEQVAVSTESGQHLSYRDLNQRANRLARFLIARGIKVGDVVSILLDRGIDSSVAMLGVNRAGAAFLPIDPSLPTARVQYIITDADVAAVITTPTFAALHQPVAAMTDVIVFDGDMGLEPSLEHTDPAVAMDPTDICWVMYTSGSTGRPKGVSIRHSGAVNLFDAMEDRLGFDSTTVVASVTSISFDPSIQDSYLTWIVGGRLVIADRASTADGERLVDLLERTGSNAMFATPLTWLMLLDAGWQGSADFVGQSGGAQLPRRLADQLLERCAKVFNLYGLTEITIWSTAHQVTPGPGEIPIGEPIQNTTFHVLDDRHQLVPFGVVGELAIGGIGLGREYLNRPELNEAKFIDGQLTGTGERLYLTGDRARRNYDGSLQLVGRLDDQVKIRGHRIELGEIETAVRTIDGVGDVAVSTFTSSANDLELAAYFVSDLPEVDEHVVRRALLLELPTYMIPAAVIELDRLPLNRNGKIDKEALPSPGFSPPSTRYVAPNTETERAVAAIWEEVLSNDAVGIEDHFFDLGGNSLLAMQIAARAQSLLGREISVRSIFDAPTVSSFSAALDRSAPLTPSLPTVEKSQSRRYHPLSTAQERMWFLHHLTAENSAYNVAVSVRVTGPLDLDALRLAIKDVTERHQTLRTRFVRHDGAPHQEVVDDLRIEPEVVRWAADEDVLSQIDDAMREAAKKPFNLDELPLLRFVVHVINPEHHVVFVNVHHIIADRWAVGLLGQDIAEAYQNRSAGKQDGLCPLDVDYVDYSEWERSWMSSGALSAQMNYWQQRLAGLKPLDLVQTSQRPAVLSGKSERLSEVFPTNLSLGVSSAAGQLEASRFNVLIGAFVVLLHRATGATDIAVGTPVANRPTLESQQLIASFVNAVVIRVDLGGVKTFSELVTKIQETTLEAFEHQNLPFEHLVQHMAQDGSNSDRQLFRAFFNLQEDPFEMPAVGGLEFTPAPVEQPVAQGEFSMILAPSPSGGTAAIEYAPELYNEPFMTSLLADYWAIVSQVISNPDISLDEFGRGTDAPSAKDSAQRPPLAAPAASLSGQKSSPAWEPPRAGLEQELATVWEKILDVKAPGRHDNFFDLGGHSLMAIRLFSQIEEITGQLHPLIALFQAPTIAGLAELLSNEDITIEGSSLVEVTPDRVGRPLFSVSPFRITTLSYFALGQQLGPDQPLYALQPRGIDDGLEPHRRIEDMATHYVSLMKTVQPEGPYLLSGHCDGSWVAFEMTRQLQAEGETVDLLLLVDSGPPHVKIDATRALRSRLRNVADHIIAGRFFPALKWQFNLVLHRLAAGWSSWDQQRVVAGVRSAHEEAYRRYEAPSIEGDLILVRSEESASRPDLDWHLQWAELISGQLQVATVPGSHAELMLIDRSTTALASHMTNAVRSTTGDQASSSGN